MAGVPQQQQQQQQGDSGLGRPMNLPSWMPGPNNPSNAPASGPSPAPFSGASASSIPMPPRPPGLGPSGATPSFGSLQMQFRPSGPPPPQTAQQQFAPPSSQQFRPGIGQFPGMGTQINMSPPSIQVMGGPSSTSSVQPSQGQFHQMPPRPTQQPQQLIASQGPPMPYNQQQRPMTTGQPQLQQQSQQLNMVPPGNMVASAPTSFSFCSTVNYAQPQNTYGVTPGPATFQGSTQVQQAPGMQPVTHSWQMTTGQTNSPAQHQGVQTGQTGSSAVTSVSGPMTSGVSPSMLGSSDWQEHTAPDGRRYYYNKRTKQSSWEKPLELMTATERADASTMWKEFTTGDGRKYYYNKITKQSTWTIPEEMKLAREKAEKGTNIISPTSTSEATPSVKSSPVSAITPTSPASSLVRSPEPTSAATTDILTTIPAVTQAAAAIVVPTVTSASDSVTVDAVPLSANATVVNESEKEDVLHSEEAPEASAQDIEEAKKAMPSVAMVNVSPVSEDKLQPIAEEPLTFANKTEAKNAFKDLLEAVHVESDWTWEQAMRVIINDKRYGALKTLGERKQAFNEYLAQRKKQEAEEKRLKQKKAREDFLVMLQESKELTSTMRWSKAVSLFSDDPRFHAMERERDRELLFEDYLVDLERKEREKAREERKKNLVEYRAFLETCDFIKANTQWRKIQDKLEDDERCSRLDKIDRLEIFQEYIRDLEKKEEEEKKIQKEQLRRRERKNRDEFRNLMEEHKSCGILTARTTWRDYVMKVKDNPAYIAVASNSSGSTPKELFDDVAEELERQYHDDKSRVKDAVKAVKIVVTSTWTLDKFRTAIAEAGDLEAIAEPNLKLVFEDLLDRAREKEEKEEKKRRRLVEDFNELLRAEKTINSSSKWEDVKEVLENAPESRALSDEAVRKKLFDEYVAHLQLKAREKERKREEEKARKEKEKEKEKEREKEREKEKEKEKEKEREKRKEKEKKEKEREREKSSKRDKESLIDLNETVSNHMQREERSRKDKEKDRDRDKEKSRKHRKRHRSRSSDDISSEKEDRDEGKRSRKHSSDRRKSSRKHGHDSGSDSENRHKRHRRDRDGSRRNGTADELEDGEVGEDGEIR